MTANELTDKAFWQAQGAAAAPFEVTSHDLEAYLGRYLPVDPALSCVEIGAYPGASLCYLAKKFGYRPTAIEYRDDAADILRLFEYNGVPGLELINADFLTVQGREFDVVTSFGFVEHFADYREVIRRHVEMTKPGGYLVLGAPHMDGLQEGLRRLLFTPKALEDLYRSHNRRIMQLGEMKRTLEGFGVQLLFGSYVFGAAFWVSPASAQVRQDRRWLAQACASLNRRVLGRLPSCSLYSPMFLCLARKPG